MERKRPLEQIYSNYTEEDFKVWKTLFERQRLLLSNYASRSYLDALKQIGFHADSIPKFDEVNALLKELTGWQIAIVQGHVPPRDFFEMLGDKIFPATCWLRTFAELDYIEEPDMFHDIFGHIPLLVNEEYADFMQAFGKLALNWHNEPMAVELLSRIYWFTIEFGMVQESGNRKIYGAGILSSPGETKFSMSDGPELISFDTVTVLDSPFLTDRLQDKYFIIDDISQLKTILPEVNSFLEKTTSPYNVKSSI